MRHPLFPLILLAQKTLINKHCRDLNLFPVCGAIDSDGSTLEDFFKPSGVSSNAQAITSVIGKPSNTSMIRRIQKSQCESQSFVRDCQKWPF
jgi:hypothetical protein